MPNAEFIVDREALRHNLRVAKALMGEAARMVVVKANAYGHGLAEIGRWMIDDGADMLAGADVSEAVVLRERCPDGCGRVLVLGGFLPEDADDAVESGAIIGVQSLAAARALSAAATRKRASVRVHLKVDTGLSRLGVPWETAADAAREVAALPSLRLEGAFTHLACADMPDDSHARLQLDRWGRVCRGLPEGLKLHCLASAGVIRYPEWRQDAGRLGLFAYGIDPGAGVPSPELRPALAFVSRVIQVRDLLEGEGVSYGVTFRAPGPMRLGIVPVGYADGYPRSLSGRGQVVVRGRRVRLLGRVCMDRVMVDLTAFRDVEVGERVALIGEGLDANEVARAADTIPNELLCRLGGRVARRYVNV